MSRALIFSASSRCAFVTALAAAAFACLGCRPPPEGWRWPDWRPPAPSNAPIEAWAVNEMERVTSLTLRRQDDLLVNPRTGRVELFAACNETVSLQVVVEALAEPLGNVRVECGPLRAGKGTLGAEHFRAYRMLPVKVAEFPAWHVRLAEAAPRPADFYDAMVPAEASPGGQPWQVEARGRLVLWLEFHVPRGTPADEYEGQIAVRADGRQPWTARVSLQVYDLVLPDARVIAAVGGFDHVALISRLIQVEGKGFSPAYLDRRDPSVRRGLIAIRQLMQVGHEHRLDLFDKRIRPLLKRDDAGEVRLDWSDYDAIVQPYLDGSAFADRVGCPVWPSPFSEAWPSASDYGGPDSPAYQKTAREIIALCRDHFPDEDTRKRLFIWPSRGKDPPGAYEDFARLARLIRGVDARTPILSELPASPPFALAWSLPRDYARLADILAPPGHWFDATAAPPRDANALADLAAGGQPRFTAGGRWISPGYPPHFPAMGVLAGPADLRAIPWLAMKYGCAGFLVPDALDWSDAPLQTAGPLQTTLFYPGTIAGVEGVLPSVRLKWLRRGLQDLAYLQVLLQRGREDLVHDLSNAMVRYAGLEAAADHYLDARLDGWVKDPEVWTAVRRILAEEAQEAASPNEATSNQLLTRRIAWRELRSRTATARVEQIRSRLALLQDADGEHFVMTLWLDLYNEQDAPSAPIIRVGALPPGWESLDGGEVRLEAIPPNTRRTAVLSLRGNEMPLSPAAKMGVPLTLLFPDGRRRQVSAVAPTVVAARVSRPPLIDGMLGEWTARPGNSAGDFMLAGRRGALEGGLAKRQTRVMVQCDDENLYFGIHCFEPNMDRLVTRANNFVRYDQLLACGEDLLEVLIDPGAKARDPHGLYGILVKPSGIVVTQRGAPSVAGGAEPWACGVKAAVTRQGQEWIVELAVPLAAFPPDARNSRFWGVNFARFAVAGQEASNWAQTPRYLYHPRNLGTLFLPPPPKETANEH
jgi:hypothetical protein